MNKAEYKKAIKGVLKLQFYAWLDILPTGRVIKPVPLVVVPNGYVLPAGWEFAPSTLNIIIGYHIPKGSTLKALVAV